MASRKTGTMAVILPDIKNPFFPNWPGRWKTRPGPGGFTVISVIPMTWMSGRRLYRSPAAEIYRRDHFRLQHTGGSGCWITSNGTTFRWWCWTGRRESGDCAVIRAKNADGAKMAVRHLLDAGCRKMAHIAGPEELVTARERLKGYREDAGSVSLV